MINKQLSNKDKEQKKSWDPQASYDKINETINGWPNWKKKAYNDMFAVSTHAKKIPIDEE